MHALQEVMSSHGSGRSGLLTAEALVRQFRSLTHSHAEEMTWSADWIGQGVSNGVDFPGIVAALTMHLEQPKGKLPPPAKIQGAKAGNGKDSPLVGHSVMPAVPTSSAESADSDDSEASEAEEVVQEDIVSEALKELGDGLEEKNRFYHGKTGMENTFEQAWIDEQEQKRISAAMNTCKGRLHMLLEVPSSSRAARCVNFFTFAMIMCSVLTLFLQPLISEDLDDSENPGECSETEACVWFGLEVFFTAIFTIELLIRLSVADALGTQTKCAFLKLPSNVLDFIAVLPFYVEVVLHEVWSSLRLLRIFRIFRIFRLARLARFARLARLSSRMEIAAPVSVVMVVIWGIYLHFRDEY